MNAVVPLLGFAAAIAVVIAMLTWHYSRAKTILDHWAESNGYEILASERRWFFRGPFFWTTSRGQEVYYVTVRTPDGQERRGWVRCGNWFLGILVNQAKVRWEPYRPPETNLAKFSRFVEWSTTFPAVLFNTGFTILAVVTLCGIVFITKPKNVMHDIPPWMWLPLLIIMAPAQIYAQLLSWSVIFAGKTPTGPAIALRQWRIPGFLKPIVALIWLCNFCIGVGIVVSLSKPHPGQPAPPTAAIGIVVVLAFLLAFAANVYLMLAVRTLTEDEYVLHRVWRYRSWIDLSMAVLAIVYYGL